MRHQAMELFFDMIPRTTPGGKMQPQAGDITGILASWRSGDQSALDRLLPMVRTELLRLARRHLRHERRNQVMQPSSLVQETVLRLLPCANTEWQSRVHFLAVASHLMRHVLVDYARQRARVKRGADAVHIPLDAAAVLSPEQLDQIVTMDLALERLAKADKRKSKVFEMRFFGGLTPDETAAALGVSTNTVTRDWNFARAWLRRELAGAEATGYGSVGPD